MTDLTPITALGQTQPQSKTIGTLTLTENAGLGLASLALRSGQTAPVPFGLTLPDVACAVSGDGIGAFWIGRGQWMLEGADQAEADFAFALQAEAPSCSVTEQTDGFVCFEIVSSAGVQPIEALITKLVNVDPARLVARHVTRTGLEHMTVFLVRRADDHLAVIGMRTLAETLWHALTTAAKRFKDAPM